MPEVIIVEARPEEICEAAVLLSHAMIVLPENRAIFKERRDRLERVFKIIFERQKGRIFFAKDGHEIIGAMRILEWPHCQMSLLQRLRLLPGLAKAVGSALPKAMKFRAIWARHDPQEPHWHLDPLGVLPGRQGQGIGSLLMQHFCTYVDQIRSPAYLETGTLDNVRLYERFGFSVKDEVEVFGSPTWLMWRPVSETI